MQKDASFEARREHLSSLTNDQLKDRFWQLAFEIVKPLSDLADAHTSPSIERSVLLRMGFSSLDAQAIVSHAQKRGLLGKGAGNLVLRHAKASGTDYMSAGKCLSEGKGWDDLNMAFVGTGGDAK
jgi:D-ornithine 4,5-aminomutase subunit alpha